MTTLVFSWLSSIVLLIPEFFLGNSGFFVPFAAGCILYFSMTTSWKNALFLAFFLGLTLDGIYLREWPLATCLLLLVLLCNRRMLPEAIRDHGALSALCSGALFAVVLEAVLLLLDPYAVWQNFSDFPLTILVRTLGFGVFVYFMDAVSRRIGATPYCVELNEKIPQHHGGRRVSQRAISPERGDQ